MVDAPISIRNTFLVNTSINVQVNFENLVNDGFEYGS